MPESNDPSHQNRTQQQTFAGFVERTSNFFRMPTIWTNITAAINNLAELKVVEYILRHTWGYREYGIKKHITVDEFVGGRKRQDGSRMDQGTGLSERAVRYGLSRALNDGLIVEEVDASDRGRVKKFYALKMRGQDGEEGGEDNRGGVQIMHPEVQDVPAGPRRDLLACSLVGERRLVRVVPGTKAASICGPAPMFGYHFCGYGLDSETVPRLEEAGLVISGCADDGTIEIIELPDHPFFVATLFQPQVRMEDGEIHPLLVAFADAVANRQRLQADKR